MRDAWLNVLISLMSGSQKGKKEIVGAEHWPFKSPGGGLSWKGRSLPQCGRSTTSVASDLFLCTPRIRSSVFGKSNPVCPVISHQHHNHHRRKLLWPNLWGFRHTPSSRTSWMSPSPVLRLTGDSIRSHGEGALPKPPLSQPHTPVTCQGLWNL